MAPYENTRKRSPQKAKYDANAARRADILALYGPANADRVTIVPSNTGKGLRTIFPRENSLVDWTSASAPQATGVIPNMATEDEEDMKSESSSERSLTPTPSRPFGGTSSVQGARRQLSRETTIKACDSPGLGEEESRRVFGNSFGRSNGSFLARDGGSSVVDPSKAREKLLKIERKEAREEARQMMKELNNNQVEVSKQIKLTKNNLAEMQARMAALEKKKAAMVGMMASLKEPGNGSNKGSGTISTFSTCDVVVKEAGYEGSTRTSDLNLMDEADLGKPGRATGSRVDMRHRIVIP